MSGITTTCFAASYAVALGLELARVVFRGRVRAIFAMGFAGAGLVAETLYLGYRAATAASVPLSSAYEWYLLAAWALVAAYLYLSLFHPTVASGIFILPLALALVAAAQFASKEPFSQSSAAPVWGAIHGTFLLLGTVAVMIGFVAGLMYLLQSNRLKRLSQSRGQGDERGQSPFVPRTPQKGTVPGGGAKGGRHAERACYIGLRLPSLEWLERANGRAIVISVLMMGAGLISGIVLNLIINQQDELPWTDPIVWQSAGLFCWLFVAALFSALYPPARHGRKVAYLTVANFVFCAIFLVAQLLGRSGHSGAKGQGSEVGVEVGGRRSEVGGRRSEVGGRRSEVGGQESEVGGQGSEVGSRRSEVGGQAALGTGRAPRAPRWPVAPADLRPPISDLRFCDTRRGADREDIAPSWRPLS